MSEREAYRIIYHGRVQGVGFRARVLKLAEEVGISGYVRNLKDGTVEVFVEGEGDLLTVIMAKIREQMARFIDREEAAPEIPLDLSDFQIRFD